MKFSLEEIYNIAKLARLNFSEKEAGKFSEDFEKILGYFNSMNKFELEEKITSGTPLGKLAGVPIAIKDNIFTKDI